MASTFENLIYVYKLEDSSEKPYTIVIQVYSGHYRMVSKTKGHVRVGIATKTRYLYSKYRKFDINT